MLRELIDKHSSQYFFGMVDSSVDSRFSMFFPWLYYNASQFNIASLLIKRLPVVNSYYNLYQTCCCPFQAVTVTENIFALDTVLNPTLCVHKLLLSRPKGSGHCTHFEPIPVLLSPLENITVDA